MKTRTAIGTSATLALFLAAGVATAGPEGATVTSGSASFNTSGATTTITASDGTIINYNSFNIGSSETVQFIQPGASATVLNRILGGSPTNIDGTLLSNGRVYFVNPAGVMFGRNAVVNVGHLYAAAANISDADFLAGRNNFTGATGAVANYGSITGDFVGLIGASVANYGTITASHGTVVMAAGNDIYLSERLGQWHVKVERATDGGTPDGSIGLAAGDTYTLAAWHDGTTTAENILIATAGDAQISGSFAATDAAAGGSLTISGSDIHFGGSGEHVEAGDTIIDEASVESALNSGLDFSVVSESSITLPFGVSIDKTAGGEATFSLEAFDRITLSGDIFNTSEAELHLNLDAGNRIELGGTINLNGGVLSAVADYITLGEFVDQEFDHDDDDQGGHDDYDEHDDEHSEYGSRFDPDDDHRSDHAGQPGTLTAGVIELRGNVSVTGTSSISTDSMIGELTADGFAALSDALQIEMLGTPANNDFGLLITSDLIGLNLPSVQTANGGGVRLFSAGSVQIDPASRFTLDGRFHQEGPASVSMGGQVTTTGDDILFAGDLTLNNNLLLRANDGSGTDALIGFQGTVDGNYALSADAGDGKVIALMDLGSSEALYSLRLRGKSVDLYGNATSRYQQTFIANTLTLHGSALTTTDMTQPIGIENSSIEVLADSSRSFAGNLVVTDDVSMRTAGLSRFSRRNGTGDWVSIDGTVNSQMGGLGSLTIDSGNAQTIFGRTVGTGVGSGYELGFLEVRAAETQLHGSVYTHGMNFYSPVAIHTDESIIHTGDGMAWFGGDIYSAEYEKNDVAFLYSGNPEIGLGTNRTPFKFTGNIGVMGYGEDTRSAGSGFSFGDIRFGDDRTDAANAASFLFSKRAQPGESLTPGFSTWDSAYVYAYSNVRMGRGQKITSFGSLDMSTGGEVFGTVTLGDVNVLGNLSINTDRVVFQVRAPGQIEGVQTEQNRIDDVDPKLIEDFAMELIVSGNLFISTTDFGFNVPAGASLAAGPQVLIQTGSSFETLGELAGQEFVQLESIDSSLFESLLGGQGNARNVGTDLYAYDLAISGQFNKRIDPNLGLGLNGVDRFEARYAERYLPGQQVLSELSLNPRAESMDGTRDRVLNGAAIITDIPTTPNPGQGDHAITLDRLSKGAVDRLTSRYTRVFGERVEEGSEARSNTEALHTSIANAWTSYRASGGENAEGFAAWAAESNPEFLVRLEQLTELVNAVDSLGLTTLDHGRAHAKVIERIQPAGMEPGVIEGMIQGFVLMPAPEVIEAPVVALR